MSADQQTAVFLHDKPLAKAMTSDLHQVEGNWYFKEAALIDRSRYEESETHTTCPWKGEASYFNYKDDDGKIIKDIAWFYPKPKAGTGAEEKVGGRVAFYVGKVDGLRVGAPSI
ncbi:hypothetical protein L486_04507 [Kwoniella mangroviensis CBS 10435]|uniref:DUF427 domain-containing protein n=1 Tax=Kwoniella mangroviensis CBS 10435 TaxID=1331196 RepID=A0A1B9ISU8_9TREE|nr:uncharacterized protein I203_06712 [Kwoniella mangroviensis CBS 8507]OCF58474.1 hypothetical protein L486_04507 [Kwoniella mangroviensis CBS 10435]OCF64128.1 hypothetical protein I203_06712 [Kwoniella mangroviensis CBS 8507]OCF78482.1 hypothetical protein I204_00422 [Kwoniella mangroviensis CBS 8886]